MARQTLGDPADFKLVVMFLRSLRRWSQEELAKASGVDRGVISDYELGEKPPTRKTLQRLANAVGLPYRFTEILLPGFRAARLAMEGSSSSPGAELSENLAAGLDRAILEATLPRLAPHLIDLEGLLAIEPIPTAEDRLGVEELWEALKGLSPGRRCRAIETERRFWTWALAERICQESVRAAAHRAGEAVELARLALRVAELAPGSDAWRSRLLGFVLPFVANSRRVEGDLPGAEEAFVRADPLWEAGASADPGLLDGTRRLDLKASLRSYQGRFGEALRLLDQALQATRSAEARGRLLIQKATTLKLVGEHEPAIATLRQAEALVAGSRDPRLAWMIRFTLATNLNQLGRHEEAEALLPEVRRLAAEMANELDLIRVRWLEAEIATGLGRREPAIGALEEVRRYFTTQEIAYDAALASLELAVIYLEEGRTAEVKRLAEEMFWIFKAQGVHQEALAAIRLFCEAAERDEATADMTRNILEYLTKARHHPELRFERESR